MQHIIDKVAWILLSDGKVLSTLSKGKDTWYLPGGKREAGETDAGCLSREIKEELDVLILADSLNFYGVFEAPAHGHGNGILVKMTCYQAQYAGTLHASSEIDRFGWLNYADREKCSAVDQLIFEELWRNRSIS